MTTPTSPDTRALEDVDRPFPPADHKRPWELDLEPLPELTNERLVNLQNASRAWGYAWGPAIVHQLVCEIIGWRKLDAIKATQPPALTDRGTPDTWRMPPPHFKPDVRWQRQPQSYEEWDAHQDTDRQFNAKRRLAFAGDLDDPRAPECMALVSRLDITAVLSRLTWLEARFENTAASALPAPPIRSHEKETK